MANEPILTVSGLTQTQVNALGFGAEYNGVGDSYSLTPDDTYKEATLAALEKKGYLGKRNRFGGHRWLTEKGCGVKRNFDRAHIEKHPEQYYD